MECEMQPEIAASHLDRRLRPYKWYQACGVGATQSGPAIFVYVSSEKHKELRELGDSWMGYKLVIRRTGPIRALTAA
jgi:hypothetical protein